MQQDFEQTKDRNLSRMFSTCLKVKIVFRYFFTQETKSLKLKCLGLSSNPSNFSTHLQEANPRRVLFYQFQTQKDVSGKQTSSEFIFWIFFLDIDSHRDRFTWTRHLTDSGNHKDQEISTSYNNGIKIKTNCTNTI